MIKQRSLSLSILAGVLAAGAGSISAHATDCVGALAPGSYDSLNVPANKTCTITSGTVYVAGNVTVGTSAQLLADPVPPGTFTVNSSLLAVNAFMISIEDATILGSVSVTGTMKFVGILFSSIGGTISVANAPSDPQSDGFNISVNTVAGNVLVRNNVPGDSATRLIQANTIGSSLVCTGNTPPPTDNGKPNTVGGAKVGQCSGL